MNRLLAFILLFIANNAFAASDHTLFYKGFVRTIELSNGKTNLPGDPIILKKAIQPTKGNFVETATIKDSSGKVNVFPITFLVKDNLVFAQSEDGKTIGTGEIKGVNENGDFTFLNITFPLPSSGIKVRDEYYITPKGLFQRKAIFNSRGIPISIREADFELISEGEYETLLMDWDPKK